MCVWCKRLCYSVKHKKLREKNNKKTRIFFSPNKKNSLQKIKRVKNVLKQKCSRITKRIIRLQNSLNTKKEEKKKR